MNTVFECECSSKESLIKAALLSFTLTRSSSKRTDGVTIEERLLTVEKGSCAHVIAYNQGPSAVSICEGEVIGKVEVCTPVDEEGIQPEEEFQNASQLETEQIGHVSEEMDSETTLTGSLEKPLQILARQILLSTTVLGHSTVVYKDHATLMSLFNTQHPSGRLARWGLAIQEINPKIRYRLSKETTMLMPYLVRLRTS